MRDALDLYDLPFYNNSGEAIPPYAIMQVDEWKDDANDRDYFRVKKPDGDGKTYIVNGPLEIAIASDGMGSRRDGIPCRYTGSTPAVDETWGPASGSWELSSGGSVANIVGGTDTLGGVTVVRVSLAGGGGSSIVWGQLINTVPANSLLEYECVEREAFDGEGFAFMYGNEEPTPLKVKAWAFNPSLNSGIRGSVDEPLRVFGEMFSVERTEGEETVRKSVFLILGHQDPLVGAVGFVREPDNNKGQALIHYDESAATVADGGPCGGA